MKPTQQTLATAGFELHRKRTRRDEFLAQMDQVVPWAKLCALIEPVYPKGEGAGRPTIGLDRMLRIYFLQQWFNLSDPAVEESLYDSVSMRQFVGIDLGREAAPDETTVCKFRHLLEKHRLGKAIFAEVNAHLKSQGMKLSTGTIVDASIINAPSSTKNKDQQRDPEMHQTKKGNQWYFGMKAHIGVDSRSKLIHSVVASAANVHDSQALPYLLHGKERRVWGDSAYRGQRDVIRKYARDARDFTQQQATSKQPLSDQQRSRNRTKSQVRAKVEHCFLIIKRLFGFNKVRYRGLPKNLHRLQVTCALTNLFSARKHLLRVAA
jgi:transposase, IS5 family